MSIFQNLDYKMQQLCSNCLSLYLYMILLNIFRENVILFNNCKSGHLHVGKKYTSYAVSLNPRMVKYSKIYGVQSLIRLFNTHLYAAILECPGASIRLKNDITFIKIYEFESTEIYLSRDFLKILITYIDNNVKYCF